MDFYGTTFFCRKSWPKVTVDAKGLPAWPICIKIGGDDEDKIFLYLRTETQWINFKNSVIEAHEKYLKERK